MGRYLGNLGRTFISCDSGVCIVIIDLRLGYNVKSTYNYHSYFSLFLKHMFLPIDASTLAMACTLSCFANLNVCSCDTSVNG